jgi:hypothetical protein
MLGIGSRVLHYFLPEPRDQKSTVPLAPELHELVRAKMVVQDENLRSRLSALKWTIDSQSTIRVLADGRPLEAVRIMLLEFVTDAHTGLQFIYPLLMVLMEFMMDIHHLAIVKAFDMKEWISPFLGFNYLEAEILDHLDSLKSECIPPIYNDIHITFPLIRPFQMGPKLKRW